MLRLKSRPPPQYAHAQTKSNTVHNVCITHLASHDFKALSGSAYGFMSSGAGAGGLRPSRFSRLWGAPLLSWSSAFCHRPFSAPDTPPLRLVWAPLSVASSLSFVSAAWRKNRVRSLQGLSCRTATAASGL